MPIFEYQCEKCECIVETIQAMGDKSPTCPECGGVTQKKPSPIAILQMKDDSGYRIRSKDYKDGYKNEYLKSKGQEVWRDKIIGG